MKSNHRKILCNISLGAGAFAISIPTFTKVNRGKSDREEIPDHGQQHFNICGYVAPQKFNTRTSYA